MRTITREHEVSELALPVAVRLATSDEVMSSIFLGPMIVVVDHSCKPLLNGTKDYEYPDGQNLEAGYTDVFNDSSEGELHYDFDNYVVVSSINLCLT